MASFNGKIFNPEVFLPYFERIPRTFRDVLIQSGALENHPEYRTILSEQTGGNFYTRHFKGQLSPKNVQNYDGETDITAETTTTYQQGVIAIGRARAFYEYDFTWELTHDNFFDYAGDVIAQYEDDVDEVDFLAILHALEGIDGFDNHIIETKKSIKATDVNTATQLACGDLKEGFALFVCHSFVATQLENLNLLEYLKYTDAKGITQSLALATINGKRCLITDLCPYDAATGEYTSYILGINSFEYCDVGVKTPVEVARDPATNGGVDTIYARWRKVLSPKGISFTQANVKTASPSADELADSTNWEIARNADRTLTYPEKAIHIAILKTLAEDPDTTDDGGDISKTSVSATEDISTLKADANTGTEKASKTK